MLQLRNRREVASQTLYSVAAAARECGISVTALNYLARRHRLVTPLIVKDPTRFIRAFTEQDVQRILDFYRQRGGMKNPRRVK
jgi:DNA-binding transcriptional MerR regulator